MAKIKIAIDTGHGSNTAGKRTPPFTRNIDVNHDGIIDIKKGSAYREHSANIGVASILYHKLTARGYDVIKTGWNDTNSNDDIDTALSVRQEKIKKAKCDYSISIHFNAYGDGTHFNSANGVGVYIHSLYAKDSKKFGEYILRELVKNTEQKSRGINRGMLAMCNCLSLGTKASIICELAFMTNEHEAEDLMANHKFWEESAQEIADAVDRYCKKVK
jgi:N-acetylmuramoyl-L-alanine amidase